MLNQTLRLAIVDDHALIRKTLKNYLSKQNEISVLIQCGDILSLLESLKTNPVDIVLVNMCTPGLTGVEAIRKFRYESPDVKIIILSADSDLAIISDLLDSGIHGYISKSDEPEELIRVIRDVAQYGICRSRLFTEALFWNRQSSFRLVMERQQAELNDREMGIIRLLWEEKSNKEIAEALFMGIRTVERLRQDMKEKVGVKSTVGLIKFAIQRKIIY